MPWPNGKPWPCALSERSGERLRFKQCDGTAGGFKADIRWIGACDPGLSELLGIEARKDSPAQLEFSDYDKPAFAHWAGLTAVTRKSTLRVSDN